jgi:hypothetical protein
MSALDALIRGSELSRNAWGWIDDHGEPNTDEILKKMVAELTPQIKALYKNLPSMKMEDIEVHSVNDDGAEHVRKYGIEYRNALRQQILKEIEEL